LREPPMKARGVFLLLAGLLLSSGCKHKASDTGSGDQGTAPIPTTLPPLALSDDTPDLLLTWVDAKGDGHTATKPADIPAEGRDQVRVVFTSKDDGTHEL